MGRPRKYHTAEELRQSKCRKSKKWYDRNKSAAQSKNEMEPSRNLIAEPSGINGSVEPTKKPVSKSAYWNSRVEHLNAKLDGFLGDKGARHFIESFYHQYVSDVSPEPIDDAIAAVSQMQTSIYRYSDELLQISGTLGTEWKRADAVRKRVGDIARGLQELLMEGMVDINDLKVLYSCNKLVFQSLE
ncbi:hypothetical protein DXG01_002337 [Tephrocybe rancida]|nr:hypothetical protein DXG01_002337 [Tephrocybe rancida]